jgi:hypothetical protein
MITYNTRALAATLTAHTMLKMGLHPTIGHDAGDPGIVIFRAIRRGTCDTAMVAGFARSLGVARWVLR